ncbi:hypothetical protein [Bradyrhizobium sp. 145]|uniref:hypothetical protein n=1 Tax=Bradyrhizobium sp. 145 TaxID=2782621 RepID=UPI001FFA1BC8|nr:hypothetical protein [Bradyrhizobium sp. 145]MCK1688311.1 hypothetical protein [Bradyrhizobium sp. 145]
MAYTTQSVPSELIEALGERGGIGEAGEIAKEAQALPRRQLAALAETGCAATMKVRTQRQLG